MAAYEFMKNKCNTLDNGDETNYNAKQFLKTTKDKNASNGYASTVSDMSLYNIGDTLEDIKIISKKFEHEFQDAKFQLVGKTQEGLTCFIDIAASTLPPIWGGVFQAKITRINKSSLAVSLEYQTGLWSQPKWQTTYIEDNQMYTNLVRKEDSQ